MSKGGGRRRNAKGNQREATGIWVLSEINRALELRSEERDQCCALQIGALEKGPEDRQFLHSTGGWLEAVQVSWPGDPSIDKDGSSLHLLYNRQSQPVIPAKENIYQLIQKHANELTDNPSTETRQAVEASGRTHCRNGKRGQRFPSMTNTLEKSPFP